MILDYFRDGLPVFMLEARKVQKREFFPYSQYDRCTKGAEGEKISDWGVGYDPVAFKFRIRSGICMGAE